ncbi:MAG: DNA repair and recombination protein RadB [Nanoarchaeota archaeon]|nr:DNA repair and recombination protein RadB [Nanoarchaeota archaeon]
MELCPPDPFSTLLPILEPAAITNLYGPPGVGKTNICLILALACVKGGGTVAYIDSEGGFAVERVKQLEPECESALQRIDLIQPKNFKEQAAAIKALREKPYDLVILDSSVALYRLEYAEQETKKGRFENQHVLEANRELSVQLAALSTLARDRNIPVLITAHAFNRFEDNGLDVVGGDAMKYWSKTIVQIERVGTPGERLATLVKHRFRPEGMQVKFEIVEAGIKPAGFRMF